MRKTISHSNIWQRPISHTKRTSSHTCAPESKKKTEHSFYSSIFLFAFLYHQQLLFCPTWQTQSSHRLRMKIVCLARWKLSELYSPPLFQPFSKALSEAGMGEKSMSGARHIVRAYLSTQKLSTLRSACCLQFGMSQILSQPPLDSSQPSCLPGSS